MPADEGIVYVVDDDLGIREAMSSVVRSIGLRVETFGTAKEFLRHQRADAPACLVLDVHLPDGSGLEVPRELEAMDASIPIIFITGLGTIPMSVRAMKSGALEFLTKPVRDEDLVGAILVALERDRASRGDRGELEDIRRRIESLTPRERDVLVLVVAGKMNKVIAAELGTAVQTVKQHRGRVMQKLEADSVAELVRLVERAAGQPWAPLLRR
jgi:FixJ family two-component response regulator